MLHTCLQVTVEWLHITLPAKNSQMAIYPMWSDDGCQITDT